MFTYESFQSLDYQYTFPWRWGSVVGEWIKEVHALWCIASKQWKQRWGKSFWMHKLFMYVLGEWTIAKMRGKGLSFCLICPCMRDDWVVRHSVWLHWENLLQSKFHWINIVRHLCIPGGGSSVALTWAAPCWRWPKVNLPLKGWIWQQITMCVWVCLHMATMPALVSLGTTS